MPFLDKVKTVLRDHIGYTGDGQGGVGPLPVGDRSTARKQILSRDLRDLFYAFAEEYEGSVQDARTAADDATAAAMAASAYAGSATGTPQFPSRAAAEAATIPGYAGWIIVDGAIYKRDPAGVALITQGGASWSDVPSTFGVDARQFGVSRHNPDNRAALQLCVNAVIAAGGGVILLPEGRIHVGGEIDCFRIPTTPRVDLAFVGASHWTTMLLADFFGADKALLRSVDPGGTLRSSPISLRSLRIGHVTTTGGVNPVLLDVAGWGQSRIEHVLFGPSNNTQLRAGSIQNLRSNGCEFWYGGYAFPVKSTAGITFSVSGNSLTASGAIFDDRDRFITIFHPTARRRYRISGYVSPTQVTLQEAGYRITTGTGLHGMFDCPRVSMVQGSNLVYGRVGDEIFVPSDVGRTALIPRAREGNVAGAFRILRARIIEYVSPHAVRIGDDWGNVINADRDVTDVRLGCPALDLYQPRGGGGLGSLQSDFMASQLHIEHYAGVGIFAETTDTWYLAGKIHGETNPSRSRYSLNTIWGNNLGGEFTGGFDSTSATGAALAYFADQGKVFRLREMWVRNAINERIVEAEEFPNPSGYVLIDGVDAQNYAGDPRDVITEPNLPHRVLLLGFINQQGDLQPGEVRFGHGSFIDHRYLRLQPGRLVLGQTVDVGSLPPGSIGISSSSGNLVFRDMGGVLRNITNA